jgi:conserved oligomeric Golgi complex subunit 2
MAKFNLPSSSSSDTDPDDRPLPFPTALARADFLTADFHAAEYLSNLPHRHQTLEDLRAELRERSAAISAELLELVNGNYAAFLSLGSELRGGEDKVEDVKMAVLGFRRGVDEVKAKVAGRRREVQGLNDELAGVRREIELGRRMLELDERVASVEERLAVGGLGGGGADELFADESDEDEEDSGGVAESMVGTSPGKLATLVDDLSVIEALADSIGRDTPFVVKVEERILRCRNTILLDLSNAMKEAKTAGEGARGRLMRYLALYRAMDAEKEAIMSLKES